MRRRYLILFGLCFSAIADTAPLAAQRVPATAGSPAVDTSAWRPLLQNLVETLAPLITMAATDTTTRPWIITLPDTTSDWKHVAAHLAATLRARAPMPTDSMYFELEVSALRERGDTASARMRWRMRRKCSDGRYHGGYENMMEPFVVRTVWLGAPVWSAARKGSVRHGDSICGN